jgi:stage IV sporulation protein FB
MSWSIRLGSVGETQVRVHTTLLLFLAWYAWGGWRDAGPSGAIDQVAFLGLLFLSVLLHEFGHIFAARHYGIGTPDILLTPIGGVARIASLPDKPRQELVIALAGPAVTLLIALVLCGVIAAQGSLRVPTDFLGLSLLESLCLTNIILLLFNLLPAFPMDGGRVFRALLAMRLGLVRGTRIAARVGQVIAVGFALLGLQGSPMLLLIALFVFFGAQAELQMVQQRHLTGEHTAARLTTTDVRVLAPGRRLEDVVALFAHGPQSAFPVTSPEGELLGILTRDDLLRGVAAHGLAAPVALAMMAPTEAHVVRVDTELTAAARQLFDSGREALPVIDAEGRFLGMMTTSHVTDVLLVRQLHAGTRATP